jgi:hypothetical protein
MNILNIIREFCARKGLPRPTLIIGNDDPSIIQMLALCNQVIEDLTDRGLWQAATYSATFTTVAAEDQGTISTICPNGYRSLVNNSLYNRTTRLPVEGPVDAVEWEAYKALPTGRIFPRYRLFGDHLYMQPAPAAAQIVGFEYISKYLVTNTNNTVVTPVRYFTTDTDEFKLDESILITGLAWNWASEKGLAYAELFSKYETMVTNALGRDGGAATINMKGTDNRRRPGILVPSGNWIVS